MKSMYFNTVSILLGITVATAVSVCAQTNVPTNDTTATNPPPAATTTTHRVSIAQTPPRIDYSSPQGILDALHSEPGTMRLEDYQYNPAEEEEHVKRMVRLAELRSGNLNVDEIRHLLGFKTDAEKQQEAEAQKQNDESVHSEIDDLRQEVQDLRQMLQQQNPALGRSYHAHHHHQSP